MTPDSKLLRQYVEKRDEAAFAEVVRRHVNLVYAAALRQMKGEPALAEDVAQATFTELVRNAPELCDCATVAGWLHATARFLALRRLRGEQRRRAREQEALAMSNPTNEISWEQLRPLLDEAIAELDERDRDAVLLRFFEEKSHREIGDLLGLSENAARMRVERALDKLRNNFSRRGVTTTAALLAAIFGAHGATSAPAAFAASVAGKSLADATKKTSGTGIGIGLLALLALKSWRGWLTATIAAILALLISWQVWEKFAPNPPVAAAPTTESTPPPPVVAEDPNTPRATEPQWDSARDFSEGLAAVALGRGQNTKWGFIDTKGNVVVPPQFDSEEDYSEGLALVKFGAIEECIDKTGKEVFQSQWDKVYSFSEGLAQIEVGGKWGFVDKTGNVVVEPQWDQAGRFSEGLAAVMLYDSDSSRNPPKWSFIDKAGKIVITLPNGAQAHVVPGGGGIYNYDSTFHNGLAIIMVFSTLPNDRAHYAYGWIDKHGRVVLDPLDIPTNLFPHFSEGLLPGSIGGKWGYVDTTGKVVIAPRWTVANDFTSDGLARVVLGGEVRGDMGLVGGQVGYIDKTGTVIVEPQWDAGKDFSDGLAVVMTLRDSKSAPQDLLQPAPFSPAPHSGNVRLYGYIDKTGQVVVEPQYGDVHSFSEGLAMVVAPDSSGKDKGGFINQRGKMVITPQWGGGDDFIGGFALVTRLNAAGREKYGFIDKTGQLIGPPGPDELNGASGTTDANNTPNRPTGRTYGIRTIGSAPSAAGN